MEEELKYIAGMKTAELDVIYFIIVLVKIPKAKVRAKQ